MILLSGCCPDQDAGQPGPKPIPPIVIQADSTDFPLLNDLSAAGYDNRVDGEFLYEENYKGNQLVIPGKMIERSFNYFNYQKSSGTDTVFVNIATLRRVIKIVGGKKIGFTYQINDFHPVRIQ
ncbi:MAG: hypothetical protein H7Z75_02745 [Ferruginibacter sp.]|nr:hypothetical protein [Cytophagales bacterium]